MTTRSSRPLLATVTLALSLAAFACTHPVDRAVDAHQQITENTRSAEPSTRSTAEPEAVDYPSLRGPLQGVQTRPNDVALIVAIEEYPFLPNVDGARQTAYDWEDFFLETLQISEVYSLIDQDASREDIAEYLAMVRDDVEPGGRLWFVFVGHGAPGPDGDDGLLVGMDARQSMSSIQARSLPRSEVIESLGQGATDDLVVILDTCFSGQAPDGEALVAGAQPVIPMQDDLREPSSTSALVLSASRSDQLAGPLPGASRPSFSYLLLGAMRGWAVDGQGDVTAASAQRFVDRQLRHVSDRRQNPQLQGPGDIVLVANATEPAPQLRNLLSGRTAEVPRQQPAEGAPVEIAPPPQQRTSPPPTAQSQQGRVDLGYGLSLDLGRFWTVNSVPDPRDESPLWWLDGGGGEVGIFYLEGKGTFYEANVDTMTNSYMDVLNVQFTDAVDDFEIPPYTGHYRILHGPIPPDGRDGWHGLFFIKNGLDLWMIVTNVGNEHPDLDGWMRYYLQLVASMRFQ